MSLSKSKTASAITIFLLLALTTTFFTLPIASAHDPPWRIKTYCFVNASPNPVGVGQQIAVTGWIDKVPPTAEGYWGSMWHDMTITVTDPDGHTETLGPYISDAVGGVWDWYTPDKVGEYEFVCNFPEQVAYDDNPYPYFSFFIEMNKAFLGDIYEASTSEPVTVVVQDESLSTAFPDTPLPTEYWARPISSMNREWYALGGNWLGLGTTNFGTTGLYESNGNFNPYTQAPNTAHVMWTEPIAFGGQIGGEFGPDETGLYATGTAYEAKFNAIILYGILYYTEYPGAGNNPTGLKAVDLRTGETLWSKPITTPLKCGMIYNFITGDQYGAHAYLFCAPATVGFVPYPPGTAWEMYDAMTGEWILNIDNATAGVLRRGPSGEILSYTVSGGMLRLWNMSKCIAAGQHKYVVQTIYSALETWRPPLGATIDWNDGYEWSVPVANETGGEPISLGITKVSDDFALLTFGGSGPLAGIPGGHHPGWRVDVGYSSVDGRKLWGPVNRTLLKDSGTVLAATGEGVYTEFTRQTMTWSAYSLQTGQKLWGPSVPANSSWAYYDYTAPSVIGYGNLYTWGLAGEVYCFDVKTGDLKWSYNTGNSGVDSPFGSWPLGTWITHHVLADGKLYVRAGHDYTPPVFKGAKLYCLNATTGEELWESLSFDIVGTSACTDGYMVWFNGYDNQIYCYGKGPSAITVTASPKVSVEGDSILVEGMVTDISPGTEKYVQTARFPTGVPAIADEDMSAWMEYLYQQQPKPSEAKGVDVTITVLDPNSNVYDVATATSNVDGFYSATFTPQVPGKYTVYAAFAGSDSYYSSSAVTAINVEAATAATPEPTPQPASAADLYFLPMSIGIIVAIIAIGLVLILMLRKR